MMLVKLYLKVLIKMQNTKSCGLTNNQLKIIAAISMLIDHVGLVFFPNEMIFRIIGRLALPIFAYMIAEGCRHTKSKKKYLGTILAMAIVFQLVYFFVLDDLYQGILVTFSLSIIIIYAIEGLTKRNSIPYKLVMLAALFGVVIFGAVFPQLYGHLGFAIDYKLWGICLPVLIYFSPNKIWKILSMSILLIAMSIISSPLQWWALLSIPLLLLYNGQRGKAKMKYFFYIFYPLHLVVIYAISFLIYILS